MGSPPPIDFSTFVYSLATQALALLGEIDLPGIEHRGSPELPAAKQTIDILEMLEEKTKGNLAGPEAKLLETLLYDLRLRYVKAARKQEG
ncbi:MAG: DUF1844 domain-containing protein [Myxococcales bacterium]|nr:MAG: DUF1844 domain-containing protein [Myxococcales bacterium]